ncbi:MAG: GAF domain-containing sensor histidine kinase [Chloroflexi bacterium]|nr:GAF domain-containing sensor histidine kinase [Chloroflexota bacterium]
MADGSGKGPDIGTAISREKWFQRVEALERTVRAVNSLRWVHMQNIDAVLDTAIGNAMEAIGGTCGAILLADKEPGMLYHRVHRGLSARRLDEIHIPVGEGLTGTVAKTGETILVREARSDARALPQELGGIKHLRGFICAPIKRDNDIMGVIVVASNEPDRLDAEDARILSSMGDCLGIAVMEAAMGRKISKGMARYQALLKHALQAQEDERKRLARELHDETSQALSSLTYRLQAALQMAETHCSGDARLIEILQKTHASAVQSSKEVVRLMMDLRPTLLDDLGMPAAIYRYAKDTLEPKGINVAMECIGSEHRLPTEVEVAFFRVTQGLISNVLKHSYAKNVSIRVECSPSKALLYVEDDGNGFNVEKITEIEPNGRGAGLFTMRERLRLIGGTAHLESSPRHGTRITVTVPIVKDLGDLANDQDKGLDRR